MVSSHSHGNSPSHQLPLQQNSLQDFGELQKSQTTKGFGFIRSRFHSTSSELVNNNLSQSKTSLANILISPTHHFPSQLKRFSPFFAQNSMNSTTSHHKSLENLDTLEHKTNTFAGSPQHFSHQNRMRPLHSHNKHSNLSGRKDEYGLPVSRGCVYLRPEQVCNINPTQIIFHWMSFKQVRFFLLMQNIPEVFSTAFKPINENFSKREEDADSGISQTLCSGTTTSSSDQTISRDDIVVTMRSVNV